MTETRSVTPAVPGVLSYGHLLVLAVALIYLTVLLGVATRAAGSGLACNANWPLCDGGLLDLFPASLPSVFEWIHRVVAGIAGLVIVATAIVGWRGAATDRRTRRAVALGALLLPVQVLLGRETVLSFTPPVLALHYWTAIGIYASFVIATVGQWRPALGRAHVTWSLAVALALVPVEAVLAPPIIASYSPPVQAAQYAVILLVFAAIIVASLVGWDAPTPPAVRYALLAAAVAAPLVVFLGRQRIVHPELAPLHVAATVGLVGTVAIAFAWFYRMDPSGSATASRS